MNCPKTVQFQFDSQGVDWRHLLQLFKVAHLGGREGDKVRRAFEKSSAGVLRKGQIATDGCGTSTHRR